MSKPLPVIPPSVRTHDNTMMSDFAKCPWWYQLRHNRGLRPAGDSAALAFGGALHDALAEWYKTKDLKATLDKIDSIDYPSIPGDYRTIGLVHTVIQRYLDQYGDDPHWDVVLNETSFDLEDDEGFRFGGRLDIGVIWNDDVWVVDHKSTSIGGSTWWEQFSSAPQMAGYSWAGSKLRGGPIRGVIINRLVVRPSGTMEFERRPYRWPEWKLEEWRESRILDYHRIAAMNEANEHPRNRYSCVGKYGKCPAFDICEAPPAARQTLIDHVMIEDRWDWSEE